MIGNTNNQTQAAEVTQTYSVRVDRVQAVKENTFAFDMTVNGIKIFGCFYRQGIKDGKEWSMITFPSHKGNNGKYYNYVMFPITKELQAEIERQMTSLLGG